MTIIVYPLPKKIKCLLGDKFFIKKVPGDNSCFYHSVLFLVSEKYRNLKDEKQKAKMCKDFRIMLSNKLTKKTFKEYKGFITYTEMKKNLLDYNVWAGNIEWKFVCDQLKINIFMFRYELDDICHGWGYDNYNPEYHSVCIMNFNSIHYDPIIFIPGPLSGDSNLKFTRYGKIKTRIDPKAEINNKILKFYKLKLKT